LSPPSRGRYDREFRDDHRRREETSAGRTTHRGRGNSPNGRDGSGKGATTFKSNEYDPSGFYDEEDDSDDEGDDCGVICDRVGDDGRGIPSMDDERHRKVGAQTDGRTSCPRVFGSSDLPVASREQRRDDRYRGMYTSSRLEDHRPNGAERQVNTAGVDRCRPLSATQDDHPHDATDELLVLLGAELAPSAEDLSAVPRNPPSSVDDDERGISTGRINDTATAHDNVNPEGESPFLAGIIRAEEQMRNLAAATATNKKWSFGGDDSYSDGSDGWQGVDDGGFDGDDDGKFDREVNENIDNNVLNPNHCQDKDETGPASHLTNFTLPSADESSSSEEGDEDDVDEDEDDDL
jgi:hypothetical protein